MQPAVPTRGGLPACIPSRWSDAGEAADASLLQSLVDLASRIAAPPGRVWSFLRGDSRPFPPGFRLYGDRFGPDAPVGERGVKLPGRQRQRIALARAMLKDAPILVLDEATSALDSEVEAAIQETLYGMMEGKTVIAIARRLSTIARLDRILVLDGCIVESEKLLARDGIYAGRWRRQSGGFTDSEEAAA